MSLMLTGPSETARLAGPPQPGRLEGPTEKARLTGPTESARLGGPSAPALLTGPPDQLHLMDAVSSAAPAVARGTDLAAGTKGNPPPPMGLAIFKPTYEWQELSPSAILPAGLDVELPLDGSARRARIPRKWQLRSWLDDNHGFWRHADVSRTTTMGMLRQSAAQHTHCDVGSITLSLDGALLSDESTAEEVGLFQRMKELRVTVGAATLSQS